MDRDLYKQECSHRWTGQALANAHANWRTFQEHRPALIAILLPYLRDSGCRDASGHYHNPTHTLTGWLWECTKAPENSWLWDFCDHYQKCHLSRGIIQYCKQLIAEIKATQDPTEGDPQTHLDLQPSAQTSSPSLP
jgi:hypothetical protein